MMTFLNRLNFNTHSNSYYRSQGGFMKVFLGLLLLMVLGLLVLGLTIALIYPKLPSMEAVTNYHPKLPLRIYSGDTPPVLLGEFGQERRIFIKLKEVPLHMKQAILAIEDDRFYDHIGIDVIGITRAMVNNLSGGSKQGASTITQQVARNFFLNNEQTYIRKMYEVLLSLKLEHYLTKDQILELYINQIYLGEHSYGFANACETYFGIPLSKISIEQAAILAGLPKAPSENNPRVNYIRAKKRSNYILERMLTLGYITPAQHDKARANPMIDEIKHSNDLNDFKSDYVTEMVRKIMVDKFGQDAYTMGLQVYTTILKEDQSAAYSAVRKGLFDYDRRHGYRGPEGFIDISMYKENNNDISTIEERDSVIFDALDKHPNNDDLFPAVVLSVSPKQLKAILADGEVITITPTGLKMIANHLSNKSPEGKRVIRGSIIRVIQYKDTTGAYDWFVGQIPEVEAAHIAINPYNGAVRALIGGFDFNKNKFNHVTQGWRQPGSSFKPFVYSAALDNGYTPYTMVDDSPFFAAGNVTGGKAWEPKNYDGHFEGAMPLKTALAKSKNMVSIRLMQDVGAQETQDWITRFGFEANKHPPYLTMALGAGSTTPWQMSQAYAVFANGGYKINAFIINKVLNAKGQVLMQAKPKQAQESDGTRVISATNAYTMHTLLQGVVNNGTATKAKTLNRDDLAGKTGTTNDAIDAWFGGYATNIVGITWVGFDAPKSLGDKETGGGVALPIWIDYMAKVLPNIPEEKREAPPSEDDDENNTSNKKSFKNTDNLDDPTNPEDILLLTPEGSQPLSITPMPNISSSEP